MDQSLLRRLLGQQYPPPGFGLIQLHARYCLHNTVRIDLTEYPPYRVVGYRYVRIPSDELIAYIALPDEETPAALPSRGPWDNGR